VGLTTLGYQFWLRLGTEELENEEGFQQVLREPSPTNPYQRKRSENSDVKNGECFVFKGRFQKSRKLGWWRVLWPRSRASAVMTGRRACHHEVFSAPRAPRHAGAGLRLSVEPALLAKKGVLAVRL